MRRIKPSARTMWSVLGYAAGLLAFVVLCHPASPKDNRAQMYMRETAAIEAVQTIGAAQAEYFEEFGRYAASLTELGPQSADLIDGRFAKGWERGYKFSLTAVPEGYQLQADPEVYGTTGSRTFFSDQTRVVRESYGREPAANRR